jgi:hypothetical protein
MRFDVFSIKHETSNPLVTGAFRMKKIILLLALLAGLGLALGGCSSSTDPTDTNTADLEDFGQYTATDESSPDFGDPALSELLAETEEEEYDDPVALSPIVDSVENQERPDIFCFRMLWGNLPRDTAVTDLTDWSGTLTISRGAIVVTHLIKFEPGQDYLLPRWNDEGFYVPEELRWVSKTSCCLDGIATKLFVPPSLTDDVVTVSYHSEQLDITFTIYELEELDTLITTGYGNAISFRSARFEPKPNIYMRGHLRGVWTKDDTGQGIFYGRWMASGGRLLGAIKGEWGVDSAGVQVFVGKWIDRSGRFQGFVKGTWEDGDVCTAICCPVWAGTFEGRIFNSERDPIGLLGGRYWKMHSSRTGHFEGRWCVGGGCSENRP